MMIMTVNKEVIKYARKCDVTDQGMNDGYVLGNGLYYVKYDKDLVTILRKWYTDEKFRRMTDNELRQLAYDEGEYYWTEWECPEDYQYKKVNGKLINID
jgi:hypothetical protein